MFTKRKRLFLLVWFSLVLVFGSGNFSAASDGEAYSRKVATFQEMLGRCQSILQPNERYEVGGKINAALLAVLRERASLSANPRDIVGADEGFALTFGSWTAFGDGKYRLVVLEPRQINMGAITAVYVQGQSGANLAEQVHLLTQGANMGQLAYSDIIVSGVEGFVLLVEKRDGPDDKYISVYTLRFEDGRWQGCSFPTDASALGQWRVRKGNGYFSLSHQEMSWKSEKDYVIKPILGGMEIAVVDKAERHIDRLLVRFAEGKWLLQ
jgi:hypothetical protein